MMFQTFSEHEYERQLAQRQAEQRREAALRADAEVNPDLQCEHGVSLYRKCDHWQCSEEYAAIVATSFV